MLTYTMERAGGKHQSQIQSEEARGITPQEYF